MHRGDLSAPYRRLRCRCGVATRPSSEPGNRLYKGCRNENQHCLTRRDFLLSPVGISVAVMAELGNARGGRFWSAAQRRCRFTAPVLGERLAQGEVEGGGPPGASCACSPIGAGSVRFSPSLSVGAAGRPVLTVRNPPAPTPACRQAPPTLAHLWCGHSYARFGAGSVSAPPWPVATSAHKPVPGREPYCRSRIHTA